MLLSKRVILKTALYFFVNRVSQSNDLIVKYFIFQVQAATPAAYAN